MLLSRANRIDEAREILIKAKEEDLNFAKHLGSLFYNCGELTKALTAWRTIEQDEEVLSLLMQLSLFEQI